MADTHPHITIGHHAHYGVVAATSHDNPVAAHMLGRVGFERLPDSDLYALTEPHRDPLRRGGQAVQSLRAAQYSVTSDAAYDFQPGPHLSASHDLLDRREWKRTAASPTEQSAAASARAQAATAMSPARAVASPPRLPAPAVEHRSAAPLPRPARAR
ncbi:hypothetical protein GTW43_24945 [Streptomyces sp. SID5785]|uniref:hypothetical protein n=1 Tax=Streptomyces sp. SID5785 TaxID=2690309 RepID=UPI0013614696|nr:hypothetical protein [Streptomyces sp. SID5785]MZD08303.1 hypothetical protein [Streptomyces sp. SID5785]